MVVLGQVHKASESSDPHAGTVGASLRRLLVIAATAGLGVTTAPTSSSPENQKDDLSSNSYSIPAEELPQSFLANPTAAGLSASSDGNLRAELKALYGLIPESASIACKAPCPGQADFSKPHALDLQFVTTTVDGQISSLRAFAVVESHRKPSPIGTLAFVGGSAALMLRRR